MRIDPTLASVGELMTRDPVIVPLDAPLHEVAELLDRYDISGLPVVDRDGALVGVISQMDLLRARANDDLWSRWPRLTAGDLMSSPVLTTTPRTSAFEAATRLQAHRVHRLVVVADDEVTPVGLLSSTDLVRAIARRVDR